MQLSNAIKEMNITDKFILLEELWDDMSKNVDDSRFTPNWHVDILNEIEQKEQNNKLQFSDFEDAKKRLQKLTIK